MKKITSSIIIAVNDSVVNADELADLTTVVVTVPAEATAPVAAIIIRTPSYNSRYNYIVS